MLPADTLHRFPRASASHCSFQVIHPDCADFGIAAQSLDTAAVFDTVIGIGLAYGMGFKCSVYLETCFSPDVRANCTRWY